jgi:hypothetical protein
MKMAYTIHQHVFYVSISQNWSVFLERPFEECATAGGDIVKQQWSVSLQNSKAAIPALLSVS